MLKSFLQILDPPTGGEQNLFENLYPLLLGALDTFLNSGFEVSLRGAQKEGVLIIVVKFSSLRK